MGKYRRLQERREGGGVGLLQGGGVRVSSLEETAQMGGLTGLTFALHPKG